MEASNSPQLPGYLKGLSYLLIVYGIVLATSSIAVLYGTFAFATADAGASIRTFAIGAGGLVGSGLTLTLGIVGRMAFQRSNLLKASRMLAIANIVATALALLCCNSIGGELPTSLLMNLIMPLCWLAAIRQKQG